MTLGDHLRVCHIFEQMNNCIAICGIYYSSFTILLYSSLTDDWLPGTVPIPGVPFIDLLRNILKVDNTIDDAIARMQNAKRAENLILGVGDGKVSQILNAKSQIELGLICQRLYAGWLLSRNAVWCVHVRRDGQY